MNINSFCLDCSENYIQTLVMEHCLVFTYFLEKMSTQNTENSEKDNSGKNKKSDKKET